MRLTNKIHAAFERNADGRLTNAAQVVFSIATGVIEHSVGTRPTTICRREFVHIYCSTEAYEKALQTS